MKEKIDLAHIHAQEKALEKAVKEAQQALSQRQRQLREFGQEIKKEIAGKLKAGGTTGDPLIDEIIPLLGIEKATIDSILGFNEALLKGKEILIAVPRRECTKHVFMPTPGCENEYVTEWGYIFGTLSGERLVIKQKKERPLPGTELTLPIKRYVKWGFNQGDADTPTEGPLAIQGHIFDDLSADKLLFSVVKDEELSGMPDSNSQLQIPMIVIDGKIIGSKKTSVNDAILQATEHGKREIKLPTPTEKLAGMGI